MRPSITGVHCGHSCGLMHGLPGPDLHDHALPSELIYGGGLCFRPCPRPSSHPPSLCLHVQSAAVWRSQEWNMIVFINPPRAAAVQCTRPCVSHRNAFLVQIKELQRLWRRTGWIGAAGLLWWVCGHSFSLQTGDECGVVKSARSLLSLFKNVEMVAHMWTFYFGPIICNFLMLWKNCTKS